jgi:phage tail sheath protein FI
MALMSPGVLVKEIDLSAIVPAVATSTGATVGQFNWGPVNQPVLVSTEKQLFDAFGKPDSNTAAAFFTAANFLAYSNSMFVIRAKVATALNATSSAPGVLIENSDDYEANHYAGQDSSGEFAARYPGVLGNGLVVSMADSQTFAAWPYRSIFNSTPGTTEFVTNKAGSNDEMHMVVVDGLGKFTGVKGTVLESYASVSKASDAKSYDGTSSYYKNVLNRSSAYIWVLDTPTTGFDGAGSAIGTAAAGTTFKSISKTLTVTISGDGTSAAASVTKVGSLGEITEITITNAGSAYTSATVTVADSTDTSETGFAATVVIGTGADLGKVVGITITNGGTGYKEGLEYTLANGVDYASPATDSTPSDAEIMAGYAVLGNSDLYDVSLIPLGNVSATVANYVIQNIAEVRKDCVVFVSPNNSKAPIIGSTSTQTNLMKAFKDAVNLSSSYGFMDSGWKYQYDRYNDVYRWIPLSGDMAGLCARTDNVADAWWSPGGYNRGIVKNVVKLACNPDQAQRDELYKYGINPVVTFPNQGTILYGDKTMQTKPSAFDRINVRRLFIVLEKAIATAAKYQLFEFNDSFTRAQFRAMVEPFLRDVQGRRGVYDFKVVCDETNNTGEVIDRNEFVADIFVKPAKSVNYITLSFVATRTDAKFEELVGAV